jgi:hypothetical protein
MKDMRLCLKHNRSVIAKYQIDGIARHLIISRENFWRQYRWLKTQYPKDMSFGIFTYAEKHICIVPMLEGHTELNILMGLANDAERLHKLPWELLPEVKCDQGQLLGLCRLIWSAKSDWDMMDMERKKPKDGAN